MTYSDKEKERKWREKYYAKNKEKFDAQKAALYRANREHRLIEAKAYRAANKEVITERQRLYREKNKDSLREKKKRYREENKEKVRAHKREYYEANKATIDEKKRLYVNKRRKEDISFRLRVVLRTRLSNFLRGIGEKQGSAVKDLGCSIDELRFYLEGKFKDGMNWENYGIQGWHIDHIIPLAYFDLTDRAQFLEACHYTNLQPLWAKENISKGAQIVSKIEAT